MNEAFKKWADAVGMNDTEKIVHEVTWDEALREVCKAECFGCEDEVPLTADNRYFHQYPTGRVRCTAAIARAVREGE